MKMFVLGASRTGKTPFARILARALGLQHISLGGASEWARRLYPDAVPHTDRESFIRAISRFSLEELRHRPTPRVEYIRGHHDLTRPTVLEGIRNPHDFVHLFDPRTDWAIFLEHSQPDQPRDPFEGGLVLIGDYLAYLKETGLQAGGQARVWRYRFAGFYDPPTSKCDLVVESEDVRTVATLEAAVRDFLLQTASLSDRQGPHVKSREGDRVLPRHRQLQASWHV
jgi:hypothetical protein